MKLIGIVLISLFVIFAYGANVMQVNDENFREVVISSGKYTLVKFYADWCRHCKTLLPTYEEVDSLFANEPNVQIVKINGDKDGRKMSKKYNIEGFPSIVMFHGTDEPIEYSGSRDVEGLSNFVQQLSSVRLEKHEEPEKDDTSHVLELNDVNFQEKVLDNIDGTSIVAFTALWCSHCKNLHPLWERLANEIYVNDDNIVVGQVITDEVPADKLMAQFGISSFPTVLHFDSNKVDDDGVRRPSVFHGEKSLENLISFINEKGGVHRDAKGKLLTSAGKITKMDEIIKDKLEMGYANNVGIELLRELDNISKISKSKVSNKHEILSIGDDLLMEPYYKKLINKIINGDTEYFEKEANRLNKMLKGNENNLQLKTIDSIQKRLNILSIFGSN